MSHIWMLRGDLFTCVTCLIQMHSYAWQGAFTYIYTYM